ncbi:MAG TPA: hypothetical protein VKZ84_00930 [Bacteriovoracaceae bacterium]|nr:hypothetical protein [Bacteriovoracaceae bacterium]
MKHILLIDPLENLNIKKDSSLMLALSMKERGIETYLLFEKDFSLQNITKPHLKVYDFDGAYKEDGIYLENFALKEGKVVALHHDDTLHMRLDPPFDSKYLRILWMLDHFHSYGIKVMNAPRGIMHFNEKLYAYRQEGSVPSFVGTSEELASEFVEKLGPTKNFILKPLDLFSGIGVEKLSDWRSRFNDKVKELGGPVILQPFIEEVYQGEVRSIYFKGKELGSILKVPQKGEFLSNIAQGARFYKYELSELARGRAEKIVKELMEHGVDWVAFDILNDSISEVNITCPGLLVEVSFAYGENLANRIIDQMLE